MLQKLNQLIPRQLRKEPWNYYSTLPADQLKANMQELFDKTNGFNFSVNLVGQFTSKDEFEATPKWQLMVIKNGGDSKVATLRGTIVKDQVYGTRVTFTVKPSSVFILFFFLGPVMGLIALFILLSNGDFKGTALIGLAFPLLLPFVMLAVARGAKKNLRDRFVAVFDLKKVAPLSDI